jgi:hypothetical protein
MHKSNAGRLIPILILSSIVLIAADFNSVKKNLTDADCTYFAFLTIIESRVFEVADSSYGNAYIARDGRYKITVGPDVYLYDGDTLYTYFWENKQVIIEQPDSGDLVASEISFVVKLDEWYDSKALKQSDSWQLVRKQNIEGDIPDSMVITANADSPEIKQIEYFDINQDLNRIKILKQQADSSCIDRNFLPDFPDSVEKVRL